MLIRGLVQVLSRWRACLSAGRPSVCKMEARHSTLAAEFAKELENLGVDLGNGGGRVRLDKEVDTGLAVITLDNPNKKNAMSGKMMLDFDHIVSDLEHWEEGKGVILWGGPSMFCSGADLNLVDKFCTHRESGLKMVDAMQNILSRLQALPMLSVALVTGKALGGGAELVTSTDFRLMTTDAQIQFLHLRMGVVPGWGGATRLVQLIGRTASLDLLTSCRRVSAEEAVRLGLADELLSPTGADTLREARQWLLQRTKASPCVIHALKTTVHRSSEAATPELSLKAEREVMGGVWAGPDLLKAVNKFQNSKV